MKRSMKKKIMAGIAALFVMTAMVGCAAAGGSTASTGDESTEQKAEISVTRETVEETAVQGESSSETSTQASEEENDSTGDASLDNPLNQDEIGEKEILVVSFGTSYNDSRRETIGAIENAIAEEFPDWSVRRAFTSQIIIDHVEKRDGEKIDNLSDALSRAVNNGVKTLVVQPTHLMSGLEYEELEEALAQYADAFDTIEVGSPLLTSDEDFEAVAEAVIQSAAEYDDGNTAICFMGHGTEAASNEVYEKMQEVLRDKGADNYYVGTVEAEPSLEDVLEMVQEGNYTRVVLQPLMVVAGDHANNDMAGDEEDSWKSVFENAGYEVECVLQGLGADEQIQTIYIEHTQNAVNAAEGEE